MACRQTRETVVLRIAAREAGDGPLHARGQQQPARRPRPAAGTRRHEGTGVGLANVCQRLDARFGSARAMPTSARSTRAAIKCRHDPAAGSDRWLIRAALKVLIADDEPLAAERLQLLLARLRRHRPGRHRQRRRKRGPHGRGAEARRAAARHRHAGPRRDRRRPRAGRAPTRRRRWSSSPPSTSSRSPRSRSRRSII